jgi:predicted methyltransferase
VIRLTEEAHRLIRESIKAGDVVIDSTVGNGHDTRFLAELVGPQGHVYGFDIQQLALERVKNDLHELGFDHVTLIHDSHSQMKLHIPLNFCNKISAIMFNLGYLPGGNKSVITQSESTRLAVSSSIELLADGGILTIIAYRGHEGGKEEHDAIEEMLKQSLDSIISVRTIESGTSNTAPRLFVIRKRVALASETIYCEQPRSS